MNPAPAVTHLTSSNAKSGKVGIMTVGRKARLGAVGIVAGLLLSLVGFVTAVAPASALADTTGLVCNNQQADANDCEGSQKHGTVTAVWDDAAETLTFDLAATDGVTEWKQLYICIPGTSKSNGADCQGNTASVLSPADSYDVTAPAANTENDKDVEFECSTEVTAVVDLTSLAALPDPLTWTLHVNTCTGGTDEAFGSTPRPVTPTSPTYACTAPTGVGTTEATLQGTTTDAGVTGATFALTPPDGSIAAAAEDGTTNNWSAKATGLKSGTSYTYTVTFSDADGTAGTGTGAVCAFTTTAVLSSGQENPVTPAVAPAAETTAAPAVQVADVVLAAPAVAPAELPRTGVATDLLIPLGLALVLFGLAAVILGRRDLPVAVLGRPEGHHYR